MQQRLERDVYPWLNRPVKELTAQLLRDIDSYGGNFVVRTALQLQPCRKARSQRNHLACCYQAWLSLKVKVTQLKISLYQLCKHLFSDYLNAELLAPRITAYVG